MILLHDKKQLIAILLGLSLLFSIISLTKSYAQEISVIEIDLTGTPNEFDFPVGIECGDPSSFYVTIFDQGQLAKVDKATHSVELINDPELELFSNSTFAFGQGFLTIARDPDTGNLFLNEESNGKAWRFDPTASSETAWSRIPLLPEIVHPNVSYGTPDFPSTYPRTPNILTVNEGGTGNATFIFNGLSLGQIVFANNFVWMGLNFDMEFDEIANSMGINNTHFSGIVRVDPITLQVTRISFNNSTGNELIGGLRVDSVDPSMLWVAVRGFLDGTGAKILLFDTNTLQVVQTIELPDNTRPNIVTTDSNNIFVALLEDNGGGDPGVFSRIGHISRSTPQVINFINTTAPNTLAGTFSVLLVDDLVIWTDGSGHVGSIDAITGEPLFVEDVSEIKGDTGQFLFFCLPNPDEVAFAAKGSAKVAIVPLSKFSGGRPVRATSTGGGGSGVYRGRDFAFGDPDSPRYDGEAPDIEQVLIQAGSLKVLARVTDTVGVKDVNVFMGKKVFAMEPREGSQSWWERVISSSDLPSSGTVFLKIVARDYNNNTSEYPVSANIPVRAFSSTSTEGSSFVITPLPVIGQQIDQSYSIMASGVRPSDQNISPQITIKSTGSQPLKNIRLVLSPELKGKFLLSDYAIKNIPAGSEYTVSLKLNGKSNVDAMNNPIPYSGYVIISVDNKTPYILELSGNIPNESASVQSLFMNMISSKAENRYKTFEKPDLRISQDTDYKITLGSGESMVKGSDELIITNTSDKPLRNLRIMTLSLSEHIMPDQRNIELLPAGSFVKVKLMSMLNDAESAKDLQGEIIVAPENGKPVSVPINIGKQLQRDKNAMYEVTTLSGSNTITHTSDSIVIRNNSEESIDNIRIILPQELARVFSLSEDSLKSIEPNGERTVHMKLRGTVDSSVKQILNEYSGDIIIVSSDGMKKIMPVNISWKGISSEHFVINARDNAEELTKATQVINFLERSYPEVTKMVGKAESKTIIYMTSSLEEIKMLSHALTPSTYVYDADVGFVWSNSEDVNILALKEFTYRTIMQNYGTYWVKQKISADNGNWLIDGIATYVTASIAGERGMIKSNLDAFIAEPVSFEWHGAPTPSQHGASHALFKFLAEKYGDNIIDKTLNNLGSTMVSNNKCDTIEQCTLLMAVYDANGWSMNDKRYDMNFATIMEEWENYLQESYRISNLN